MRLYALAVVTVLAAACSSRGAPPYTGPVEVCSGCVARGSAAPSCAPASPPPTTADCGGCFVQCDGTPTYTPGGPPEAAEWVCMTRDTGYVLALCVRPSGDAADGAADH